MIVAIHAHECSTGCDDENRPRGAANFLKQLAREAIDSGADVVVITGNHNLGPIEVYKSPTRGYRAIFYGLGNFFWSDVQELLPHDLFQANRALLAKACEDPSRKRPNTILPRRSTRPPSPIRSRSRVSSQSVGSRPTSCPRSICRWSRRGTGAGCPKAAFPAP